MRHLKHRGAELCLYVFVDASMAVCRFVLKWVLWVITNVVFRFYHGAELLVYISCVK